jgi:hypothetical protein
VALCPAAAGKVRTRAHLAAAEGGHAVGGAAADGGNVHTPTAESGAVGVVVGAAAVVVHTLILTSVVIAIATSAAADRVNSRAPVASWQWGVRIGFLAVNVSFATGRPDLIDHGLTAAACRYAAAVNYSFSNASSFSNYFE